MFLVAGYPKTGNTWVQVFFSYILDKEAAISGEVNQPKDDFFTHGLPGFNSDPYYRMHIFSSEDIENSKVVLLIRHPGDVLVSLYMHNVYRERFPLYHGTVDDMVSDPIYGINKYLMYYQWWYSKFYKLKSICIIRYEDMKKDPLHYFKKMLQSLNILVNEDIIKEAVSFSSFENMKKMELNNHLKWSSMQRARNKSVKAMKVREGKVGNYKNILKPETVELIHKSMSALPSIYEYS